MSSIKLADVDDYINPSQACINPLFTSTKIPAKDSTKNSLNSNSNSNSNTNSNSNSNNSNSNTNRGTRRRRRRTPLVISEPQQTKSGVNSFISPRIKRSISPSPGTSTSTSTSTTKDDDAKVGNPVKRSSKIISYGIDDGDDFQTTTSSTTTTGTIFTESTGTSKPLVPIDDKKSKAEVSVADCLACSGCITSAEAVLVTTQHSIKTLLKNCDVNNVTDITDGGSKRNKRVVFTISPVVIGDLIRVLMTSSSSSEGGTGDNDENTLELVTTTYQKLTSFLNQRFNASTVLDGTIPQQISLIQSAIEFCTRYRYLNPKSGTDMDIDMDMDMENRTKESDRYTNTGASASPNTNANTNTNASTRKLDSRILDLNTPSIALSATETRYLVRTKSTATEGIEIKHQSGIDPRLHFLHPNTDFDSSCTVQIQPERVLPMMASSCPGFVCYVEKTTPDIISNLCTVKSPMAIAGSMFKHNLFAADDNDQKENKNAAVEKLVEDMNMSVQSSQTGNKNLNDNQTKDVYHVAIMPCHDKKLEAERKDLAWERYIEQEEKLVADIDLVITTNELFSILIESSLTPLEIETNQLSNTLEDCKDEDEALKRIKEYFHSLPLAPLETWADIGTSNCNGVYVSSMEHGSDNLTSKIIDKGHNWTMKGSGSYADFVFRFASLALFGHCIPMNEALPWKNVTRRGSSNRNNISNSRKTGGQNVLSDHSEISLYLHYDGSYSCASKVQDDKVVLKFATAYGFKNIQLLMQQIRSVQDKGMIRKYDYVETMACPSGCLNGGGQINLEGLLNSKMNDTPGKIKRREKPSERRDRMQKVKRFITDFAPSGKVDVGVCKKQQETLLHTKFHVVPKLELATGSTAGVKVDDTHW